MLVNPAEVVHNKGGLIVLQRAFSKPEHDVNWISDDVEHGGGPVGGGFFDKEGRGSQIKRIMIIVSTASADTAVTAARCVYAGCDVNSVIH